MYHAPSSLDAVLTLLAELGEEAKVLAGGQSLIPMLNMRLATPAHLVDINRIPGLGEITTTSEGVRIGALSRHAEVERDEAAAAVAPLLGQALRMVAHPVIRNRGTTLGSIVHADPSGEMVAVLHLHGGEVEVKSRNETRIIKANDFFLGPLETSMVPGELATSAFFPAMPAGTLTMYVEQSRRHGDYAMCGVAVAVQLDDERKVRSVRTSYVSVTPDEPVLDLTAVVEGQLAQEADWVAVGKLAGERCETDEDIHATAQYRAHLAEVLTERACRRAIALADTNLNQESA